MNNFNKPSWWSFIRALAVRTIASISFAWILCVPIYYLINSDINSTNAIFHWMRKHSFEVCLLFLASQFLMLPYGLVLGSRLIAHRVRSRAWLGALNGLVFGLGLNTVYLVVPYLGLCPNFVTLFIAMNLIDGKYGDLSFDMTVFVGNLIIYPALFALVYHNQPKPLPPRHCRHCDYNLTGNVSGRCPECGQVDWMPEL